MDEVRISSVARSLNWLWATYQNIASNESFESFGLEFVTNRAPVLAAVSDRTAAAGVPLVFTNEATDADAPPQSLAFQLLPGAGSATLGATNGAFAWRPAVAQAGMTNAFGIVVTDNGTLPLSAT